MIPYRKSFEEVGATFQADIYCIECSKELPAIDPEGNPKHPVFLIDLDNFDNPPTCGSCHEEIN